MKERTASNPSLLSSLLSASLERCSSAWSCSAEARWPTSQKTGLPDSRGNPTAYSARRTAHGVAHVALVSLMLLPVSQSEHYPLPRQVSLIQLRHSPGDDFSLLNARCAMHHCLRALPLFLAEEGHLRIHARLKMAPGNRILRVK